jgi:hypothetical protein
MFKLSSENVCTNLAKQFGSLFPNLSLEDEVEAKQETYKQQRSEQQRSERANND